jgi:hypothetical protein
MSARIPVMGNSSVVMVMVLDVGWAGGGSNKSRYHGYGTVRNPARSGKILAMRIAMGRA